jgi:arylamine N-acetyltransferase
MLWWIAVIAIAGQGVAAEISGGEPKFAVAPPASWVKPQFFNRQSSATNLESGADEHWLLSECQINASENETFHHMVWQILNVSAVEGGSKLTIDFNPDYQSLTLHWARIWRGPEHLERLDTNAVKIIQREQELDDDILNGEQSALLVMDDVRVGDIIDYAYSIKGSNPVLGDRFFSAVPIQTDQPVERFFTRVLWPAQKRLYAKTHGCSVEPVLVPGKDCVEYIWDLRQTTGIQVEDSLPVWFDPEPWVQLSEFKTWAEVNQWALPLFQNAAPLSPELLQKIAEWRLITSPEEQVLAALRFVQDDVRYFGVEIAASSEKPADPSVVFARRYGDCKDKSLLFVTILNALGIEAYPVLVNSVLRHTIEDWQPTSSAFDHCIAVVRFEGQTYWLDPTIHFQRGPLAAHYLPDYGCGLVVSPKTSGLSVIQQTTGLPQTTTTEYFGLGKKTETSTLKVVTIADRRDADNLRAFFATTKRSDIERSYTHFYADRYPKIKMSAPIDFEDNEEQNRIQMTETYTIDDAWTRSDKGEKYSFEFYPSAMDAFLKTPVDTERTMPVSVPFPEHQILRTEITLPAAWPADTASKTVSDSAFFFQKSLKCFGNKIVMNCEYQSLMDSAGPDQAAQYIQHLNQASKSLGYSVSW